MKTTTRKTYVCLIDLGMEKGMKKRQILLDQKVKVITLKSCKHKQINMYCSEIVLRIFSSVLDTFSLLLNCEGIVII